MRIVRHSAWPRGAASTTAAAVCLLLALTGCSNSSGGSGGSTTGAPSPSSATSAANHLTIRNFAFHPAALSVAPGAVVTVTNADQAAHTVTSSAAGGFDTGSIAPGQTATFHAPKAKGKYPYMCTIHPFMKGTLTVA